ncbi:ABC transporter ATP-binding protein [Actinomyces urogenitalis]|uniref:ABC transporter ATP-binding protein n=1 Tax=Actinomyces urogenitalis TaxID=103621 RepID=UPI00311A73E1
MTRLELDDVGRVYQGAAPVHALRGVTLRVEPGDYLAIEGPSGSGKSTLLNQIALLDTPTSGKYTIDGIDTAALSDAERARLRSRTFAFIFQAFHLLDGRTVLDNVALGTLYQALPSSRRQEVARDALEFVGLAGKLGQRTSVLSGGERQRVAIARAITSGASIIVADEPTGNLDQATGQQIMQTLEGLHDRGATLIVVTHDAAVAARAHRRLHVLDGEITEMEHGLATGEDSSSQRRCKNVASVMHHTWDTGSDPDREEKNSRVRLRDAFADAWKSLWTRTSRTMVLIASVALGVGLALTTAGMSATAQGQVSGIFDAQRNQRVGLSSGELTEADQASLLSQESLNRMSRLSGVKAVSIFTHHGQASASVQLGDDDPHRPMRDIIGVVDGQISDLVARVETAGPPLRKLEQGETSSSVLRPLQR